jgi:hypothetical protein
LDADQEATMQNSGMVDNERIAPEALEQALPSLLAKLKKLQTTLSAEEQVVFGEIVDSAALHTRNVQADDEGDHDKAVYSKPKSVHSTVRMKETYLKMPEYFGTEGE